MRILLICNEYPPRPHAGIGTAVQGLARGLCKRGHEVTVVGMDRTPSTTMDGAIKVFTIKENKRRFVGGVLSRINLHRWVSTYVRSQGIDLIECPEAQGFLPFRVKSCPVVLRLHLSFTAVAHVTGERPSRGVALFERLTLSKHRSWIGVSRHVLDLTRRAFKLEPSRSTTIYNFPPPLPASLPARPPLPSNFVLYVGHVFRRKGADKLAQALTGIMSERPDLHLVYIGGVFRENGQLMSDEILNIVGPKLRERVHFLGRIDRDVALSCMSAATAFAFPSHVEGFPLVILEAMRSGVPIVYTKFPPGPEIIEDGTSGLLADPSAPGDFGEKVSRILNDSQLAKKLGANAQIRVARLFSEERCISESEAYYRESLGLSRD